MDTEKKSTGEGGEKEKKSPEPKPREKDVTSHMGEKTTEKEPLERVMKEMEPHPTPTPKQ